MSRGRGRPPHRMFRDATEIAERRGDVILVPGGRSDSFDLIICEEFRNVFVRFRVSGLQFACTMDVIRHYERDIKRITRMPQTRVMAWELWLRLPHGRWQFFLIRPDSIVEIRADGTILYRPVLPVPVADTEGEKSSQDEECPFGEPAKDEKSSPDEESQDEEPSMDEHSSGRSPDPAPDNGGGSLVLAAPGSVSPGG